MQEASEEQEIKCEPTMNCSKKSPDVRFEVYLELTVEQEALSTWLSKIELTLKIGPFIIKIYEFFKIKSS